MIIQSFDVRTLQVSNQYYPRIRTALLIEENDRGTLEQQLNKLGFDPTIYSPHHALITKELVAKCKLRKIAVIPWTVNDPKRIKLLRSMGVDGIITDDPSLFDKLN